jgi:hypothetical protein
MISRGKRYRANFSGIWIALQSARKACYILPARMVVVQHGYDRDYCDDRHIERVTIAALTK